MNIQLPLPVFGVTFAAMILRTLSSQGEATTAHVTERLQKKVVGLIKIKPGTIATTMTNLRQQGLVQGVGDRAMRWSLTEAGKRADIQAEMLVSCLYGPRRPLRSGLDEGGDFRAGAVFISAVPRPYSPPPKVARRPGDGQALGRRLFGPRRQPRRLER